MFPWLRPLSLDGGGVDVRNAGTVKFPASPPSNEASGLERILVNPAPAWAGRTKVRNTSRHAGAPVTALLYERVVHVPSQAVYSRTVQRLETPQAVQQLSRVEIPFDPEVQILTIHSIGIFRNGNITNHARIEDFEIIRREQRLDDGILNGELSALLILKDVRSGDILDVEFSVTDDKGLFGDRSSWLQAAGYASPVGDWRFVWVDEDGVVPRISKVPDHLSYAEQGSEGLVSRIWTASDIPEAKPDDNLPPEIFPIPVLQLSTFGSWGEIVERLLGRWDFVPASRSDLDVELEAIRALGGGDVDKLVDAAVFSARDAVRYQAYSPGLLAMVPENLSKVWERRYGDCKEKSMLLTWYLRELGIEATPVLVNSSQGKALPGMLPSPRLFDHVVTRVRCAGRELWIDATDLYRGGRPSGWTTLPFSWGLPLEEEAEHLVAIPAAAPEDSFLKVRERLKPDSRSRVVSLDYEIVARGRRADLLRGLVDSQGNPGVQRFLQGFIGITRQGVELLDDPEIEDDRDRNEMVIRVRARIARGVVEDPEYARDFVKIAPFSYAGLFSGTENWSRKSPLDLGGLCRIEHEIVVDHPELQRADLQRQTVKNPSFEVDAGSRLDQGKPVYWFSASILSDRVEPADMSRYRMAMERAYGLLDLTLQLPAKGRRVGGGHDPETRWGGGLPSPQAARVGQAVEAANIVKYVCIGIVVLAILVRVILILV